MAAILKMFNIEIKKETFFVSLNYILLITQCRMSTRTDCSKAEISRYTSKFLTVAISLTNLCIKFVHTKVCLFVCL
jgi:hypothetical protein